MTSHALLLFFEAHWITILTAVSLALFVITAWSMYLPRKGQWRFEDSPQGILRRQFLDGDIDKDEYRRRHAALEKMNPAA
jgi:uncharacterized membrane protein